MSKTAKKIWNIITWVLICLVLAFAVMTAGIKLVGITPYSVLSGSMEPTYHVGSLVYVKNEAPENLKVGDAITFRLKNGSTLTTHRIVAIDSESKSIVTKGDANEIPDGSSVSFSKVVGKAIFTIPYLGYLTEWISTLSGKIISVTCAIVFVIFLFIPEMLDKAAKSEEKKSSPKEEITNK